MLSQLSRVSTIQVIFGIHTKEMRAKRLYWMGGPCYAILPTPTHARTTGVFNVNDTDDAVIQSFLHHFPCKSERMDTLKDGSRHSNDKGSGGSPVGKDPNLASTGDDVVRPRRTRLRQVVSRRCRSRGVGGVNNGGRYCGLSDGGVNGGGRHNRLGDSGTSNDGNAQRRRAPWAV